MNFLENGLVNGIYDNSHIGLVRGLMGQHERISEVNTFIFTIKTTSTKTLDLPLIVNGVYNFWIDWGDGKKDYIKTYNQTNKIHTYPIGLNVYTIKITGVCRGWSYSGFTTESTKLLSIEQFGCLQLLNQDFAGQFRNCSNLKLSNVKDTLNTRYLSNLSFIFLSCSVLNINLINNWNVSNVTNMSSMFFGATNFNQPIGNWNVSNVTNMSGMFHTATNFNQPIGNWNVSNVTNMSGMFHTATNFNQPIGNWNVSNVTNMSNMFLFTTEFNQDIGNWNVSNVSDFFNFMGSKTPTTLSSSNLDSIFNGWIKYGVRHFLSISFGTARYTSAGNEAVLLLTRWSNIQEGITNITNNGSGLIRVTGFSEYLILAIINDVQDEFYYASTYTGMKIFISGVLGTTEANGMWTITVVDSNTVDLIGSTFSNTYVSGSGYITTGFGWSITSGGLEGTFNITCCPGDTITVYSNSLEFVPGVYVYTDTELTIPFSGELYGNNMVWNVGDLISTEGGYQVSNGLILNGLAICN